MARSDQVRHQLFLSKDVSERLETRAGGRLTFLPEEGR
jgi:hypothetical protein